MVYVAVKMGEGLHEIVKIFELKNKQEFQQLVQLIDTKFELASWQQIHFN